MQRMRQQLELMQAELLCARAGGPSNTEVQVQSSFMFLHLDLAVWFGTLNHTGSD